MIATFTWRFGLKDVFKFNFFAIDKIKDKWDCLSISDKNIKLIDNGFLFVDEITKDLFV